MSVAAAALVPLTILIGLGVALKRTGFLPDAFWPGLDRLNYWVFFPSLIFVSLATGGESLVGGERVALATWAGLGVVSVLALLSRTVVSSNGPAFTSVFQGAIRFNSYVAFLVVPVLYPGSDGLVALLVGLTVPVVNVFCVIVLARFGEGAALQWRTLLRSILSNPLIVASLLGIFASLVNLQLGSFESALRILGQAALAAGLLSVGATLRFRQIGAGFREIAASMVLKFVALPLVTAGVGIALDLPATVLAPLLLFQSMPTASASYVLARAMRGDEQLMASILAVHTLAALAWLPLAYTILQRWLT